MTYLRVLRHRDFNLLFLGQSASAVGDQVVIVALALYITRTTGSATDLGLVLAAQSVPLIALLLFGGVWADRMPRHRIMIVCDVIRAVLHGILAALIFAGTVQVWQMVVLEAGFGAARAFFQPAYSGLIPQTVPEEQIQDARALTQASENLAVLIGPVLATVLVIGVGAGEAFALDAATFVLSAVLLLGVHPRQRGPSAPAPAPVLRELHAGWREVITRPWVWVTILAYTFIVMTVYAQWYALAPVISRDFYGGAGVFGVLEAVAGAGALLAALAGVVWRPAKPLRAGLILALLWPAAGLAFALGAPLGVVIVWMFASGFGFALLMIWWEVALAEHIPPYALSRVSAYDWAGSLLLLPVGFLIAGPLADALGARTVLGVGCAIGLVLTLAALIPRSTRELRSAEASSPSAEQLAREVAVEAGGEA
jgi:MFS family permease